MEQSRGEVHDADNLKDNELEHTAGHGEGNSEEDLHCPLVYLVGWLYKHRFFSANCETFLKKYVIFFTK